MVGAIAILIVLFLIYFFWRIQVPKPEIKSNLTPQSFIREKIGPDSYRVNNSWLRKNKYGIWEMYIEGDDYERGVIYGVLSKELIEKQEVCFVDQINDLVPNKMYQTGIKYSIAWFNKDIYKFIPLEYQREMYGVSLSFSDKYDNIAPKYYRILNYHAAHDIGHALNDYHVVGCTSFAVTNECSQDSTLLIGRNFDFSLGDEFAKEKLLVFVKPKNGYAFASYSWAGFIGVVSGMNEKGLTVTINASKSDIPYSSKEPISILAREILQYAKNIDEAIAIAKKRDVFVSESLLIGSAEDNDAALIEKSPQKMDIFRDTKNQLICANHFQGKLFMQDSINLLNIQNSDSKYRFDRVNQLLLQTEPLDPNEAAGILRNKEGVDGKDVGLGNQKSINQLIAHHSVIFKPSALKMWISSSPYQLGIYVCYDFNAVIHGASNYVIDSLNIAADTFLYSKTYQLYEKNKITKQKITKFVLMGISYTLSKTNEMQLIHSNPNYYGTYQALGDYYKKIKNYAKAKEYYLLALHYELASKNESEKINGDILECETELAK